MLPRTLRHKLLGKLATDTLPIMQFAGPATRERGNSVGDVGTLLWEVGNYRSKSTLR